jgi:DEAD/DEAH box helicase domain-containing protein
MLRSVVGEQLDIDPEEIDISNLRRIATPLNDFVGEIVFSDHLANGAGFTEWLAENLGNVLAGATDVNPPGDSFIGAIVATDHRSRSKVHTTNEGCWRFFGASRNTGGCLRE